MKASEIISADIQARGENPTEVLNTISAAVKAKKAIVMQSGNTVLYLLIFAPGMAELHIFTKDRPVAVGKALQEFVDKIRSSGLEKVYATEAPPQIMALLKFLGVESEPSDNPKYKWMARV